MKRGPVIHGALLLAALVFAYQTWTREEVVAPLTGDVVVWSMPPASIQAITLEAEGRAIRIERRSDQKGPYLWGADTRTIEQYQERPKDAPDAAPTERPFAPKTVSTTREFMLSEKGDELFANLAELRALRALGKLDENKRELYDLHQKTQTISVIHQGGTRSLVVGGKIFGGADRYALDPSTGEAYVISHVVVRDLSNGEAGLRLSKIHDFVDEDVGKAVIEVKGQKRTLLRITAKDEAGRESRTWADAQVPDKPDQTMANFLRNIDVLRPARFVSDTDESRLKRVLRVDYQTRVGAPLGWVELYEMPAADVPGDGIKPGQQGQTPAAPGQQAAPGQTSKPEQERRSAYLMLTEVTRVLAGVPYNTAARITADIDQIFGQ